jgi:deazaflavin-dependent oxidoreductase (nitroreductase family)
MPLGQRIARLNKIGLNRVTRHIAPWAPGFGLVIHQGRKSGREFRTPVNVFRRGDGFTFALTYGADADWVRNVTAAGGCTLITRRVSHRLTDPVLSTDASASDMPPVVRNILRLTRTTEYLHLRIADGSETEGADRG